MSDIYFQGFWRMDWGLGNPNKTAALIATLMVAVWCLAYFRKWGFWISLVLFSGLGICLIHTFSRGGIVAAFLGLAPLLLVLRRPWPWRRVAAAVASIWIIVGASITLQAHERFGQGVLKEDRSISNRFEIWKSAPAMMVDAPGGWGMGKSGQAYMDWYQPLDRAESYRTLVNSHLTWLVEFGWPERFLYVTGWLMVFLMCFPTKKNGWLAVPFGVWVAFFTGAFFTSVAESVWLWIVPILALAWVLGWQIWSRAWPSPKLWVLPPSMAAAACLLLVSLGDHGSQIQKKGHVVLVGGMRPDCWIVLDKKVLGDKPGRSLRGALPIPGGISLGVVENVRDLPQGNLTSVILSGNIPSEDRADAVSRLKSAKSVTLVNPPFFPKEFAMPEEPNVLIGEFSQSPAASAWAEQANTRKLPGVADFLPDWPKAIFEPHEQSQ